MRCTQNIQRPQNLGAVRGHGASLRNTGNLMTAASDKIIPYA